MGTISRFLFALAGMFLFAAIVPWPLQFHASMRDGRVGEARSDRPDDALKFRRLQMEDEKKKIPIDGLLRAKKHVDLMKAAQAARAKAAGKPEGFEVARLIPSDWRWLGPGNVGGRIRSLLIDPNNGNNMWAGSVGGGIWRTTNAGTSWAPVNDFLANLTVSTIAINPTNSNILFAGTGEGFGNTDALRGGGIFQSTDGGSTWNLLANTNPTITPAPPGCGVGAAPCPQFWFYVNRIAVSPDGATILAATNGGVARSSDGGANWTQRTATQAMDVDFRPNDSTRALVGELGVARYSTNGGVTWTAAVFNPAITTGGSTVDGRTEIAYAANANPQVVYAAVNNNNGDLYRSSDGGQNFARVNTGTNFFISGAGNQGWYDNALWVNPLDSTFVIVGGIDLFRSTDSGATFTQISRWQCGPGQATACGNTSAHADQHGIVAPPGFNNTTNKTVYFVNDGGVFKADDVSTVAQQSGWTNLNNNLGITQFFGGVTSASGSVFGGTQDNGSVKADPSGTPPATYNPQGWLIPAPGDGGQVAADPTDANYIYGERPNLALFRSNDAGATVTTISAGIADASCTGAGCSPPANFVAPFVLDPNNPGTMLAGGLSLWRSTDVKTATPPTWSAIKTPVSDGLIPPSNVPISAIAVAPGDSNTMVVGHNGGQIYRTTDGGTNWSKIDIASLPKRFVTRVTIDATRTPNWIYATFGGFSPDNVYVTKDLGTTWTDITGSGTSGLPDVPVRSLIINLTNPNLLYVGTEVGVFASEDAGATWQLPQGGPANVSVDELFWSQGYLMAATHGRGVYTTNNPVFKAPANCAYPTDECPGYSSPCVGFWDCPCTWNSRQVPTANDDIAITCPVTVRGGSVHVRNLRVNGRLSLYEGTAVYVGTFYSDQGTISNFGTIDGGGLLQMKDLLNAGTINVSKVWAAGDISSTGIVATSGDWGYYSGQEYPVQARNLTLTEHGSLSGRGVSISGNLYLTPGATLTVLSTSGSPPALPALVLGGDAHNDGLVDNHGELIFPLYTTHNFTGTGVFRTGALTIGDRINPLYGGGNTITLGSDVTLTITGLTDYGYYPVLGLLVGSNGTINLNGHALYLSAPKIQSYGQFNLGAAGTLSLTVPNQAFDTVGNGRNSQLGPAGFAGTGTVILNGPQNITGNYSVRCDPTLRLQSGILDATLNMNLNGQFIVDAGATFNFNSGNVYVTGDVTINGTLGKTSAANVGTNFNFFGNTFTNNGSVAGDFLGFNYGVGIPGPPNQTITGTGTWPSGREIWIGFPDLPTTLTLANDVTLNWGALAIWSNSSVNTSTFTLSMPCSTTFDTNYPGLTGEIIGNVRRSSIGSCAGAVPFNSAWTSVQFNSGTPPSEVIMSMQLTPPVGLTNSVLRNYSITPIGGSGYSSTLRLHYLDSELNGNDENALALWRNNGTSWNAQGATSRDTTANWVEYSGVTQFSPWGLASCAMSILPASKSVASGGGMDSFQVISTGGCSWSAASNAAWITVTSGASGTGNGDVGFNIAANTGASRSGTITVTGAAQTHVFTINQAADCSGLMMQPTSQHFDQNGGSGDVTVTATGSCDWTATSQVPWIAASGSGLGNGSFSYTVYYNSGPARTGTINAGGQTFTVTQDSGCAFYLYSTEQSFASAGGNGSVYLYTDDGCPWTAVSNTSWISVTSTSSGTGETDVTYSVAANSGAPRQGTINIAGQTFTVRQGSNTPLSLVVTNINDTGTGSLRQALLEANHNFGQLNTITFNIVGPVTITPPGSGLPPITSAVVIDGINADGRRIILDGNGTGIYGLEVESTGSTIRGLCFTRFGSIALYITGENTTVENCYFGTTPDGATDLGNFAALEVDSSNNHIGSATATGANIIASSSSYGLFVYGSNNFIQNNYIGLTPTGVALPNYAGILIGASNNVIGGTMPDAANNIANNSTIGVLVYYGNGNAIRGNAIFNNGGLGIDLGYDGVTPNDDGDFDTGANNRQNFPVLAATAGADTINGKLDAAADTAFQIDFYTDADCDSTGYGEGSRFLGSSTVTTNAVGHAVFTFNLPSFVSARDVVTATATDPNGNTSEFSACVEVTPLRIGSIQRLGNGHILLQGIGVPDQLHTLILSTTPTGAGTTIQISVDGTGHWQYEDASPAASRFYRLAFP